MKTHYLPILAAAAFALALAHPCLADQTVVTTAPQTAAPETSSQPAAVPQTYVWDGQEYVGQSDGKYYYLAPNNNWVPMDADRQQRFEQWQKANPNWQQQEIRNTHYRGHDQGQSQMQSLPNNTAPNNTAPNSQNPPAPANPGQNNPPK